MDDDCDPVEEFRPYESRDYDRASHRKYVKRLLRRLIELEKITDPKLDRATLPMKDHRAWEALATAGHLVRATSGWALDHVGGLALEGLQPVPRQPSGTLQHAEYLAARATAEDHRFEKKGGKVLRKHNTVLDPVVARTMLAAFVQTNPGGMPHSLRVIVSEALMALKFGATRPVFKPATPSGDKAFGRANEHLAVLRFVKYREGLGMKPGRAQIDVAEAFGIDPLTLKKWAQRLRRGGGKIKAFGNLHVAARLSTAYNLGTLAASARKTNDIDTFISVDGQFGDAALQRAAVDYKTRRGDAEDEAN